MAQGSNVPAVKADLVRMGKKVLLVEGRDDWHNLGHLLKATTGTLPSYELGTATTTTESLIFLPA
jgi:5S rRNA maturation endonuclease (ribonuclease M5)